MAVAICPAAEHDLARNVRGWAHFKVRLISLIEGPEGGGGINPISQPKFCTNPISQPDLWPNPSPSSEILGKSQCIENES